MQVAKIVIMRMAIILGLVLWSAIAVGEPTTQSQKKNSKSGTTNISNTSSGGSGSSPVCPLDSTREGIATKKSSGLLCYEGVLGQWFPQAVALRMLKNIVKGQSAINQVSILEKQIGLSKEIEKSLKDILKIEKQKSDIWKNLANNQAKLLMKKDSWYNSNSFWFSVGMVTSTLAFSLVIIASN